MEFTSWEKLDTEPQKLVNLYWPKNPNINMHKNRDHRNDQLNVYNYYYNDFTAFHSGRGDSYLFDWVHYSFVEMLKTSMYLPLG